LFIQTLIQEFYMKLKMKLAAAAVAMVAASGANAAMDNFNTGNSSLAFIALDSVGSPISAMMDLDFNLDTFLPAATATPGTKIEWNFGTNTLSIDNVVQAGRQTDWSGALASFNAVAQSVDTKWGVIAGDSVNALGVGASPIRYLTTVVAGTPIGTVDNQTKANLANFSLASGMVGNHSALQVTTNGSTAISGTGYVGTAFGLGTAGSRGWQNNIATGVISLANEGSAADFYLLDGGGPLTTAATTAYAGTFSYAAGVLTYEVAGGVTPIPEPETYAMLLAGLGMIGFMARRRLNNNV
jgi:PEP-CTERM motif